MSSHAQKNAWRFALCAQVQSCLLSFVFSLTTLPSVGLGQSEIVDSWRSFKESVRTSLAPLREPKYDCVLLARTITQSDGRLAPESIKLDALPKRVVLVVGGLQTSCEAAKSFAKQLENQLSYPPDLRVGAFDYPNDGSIEESGKALAEVLLLLFKQSPATKLSLVTHSMGGLVARSAFEHDPKRFPNVDQLVMICPPNQGSVLAQYADALELADAFSRLKESSQGLGSLPALLVDDGLGEACEELVPNSYFLSKLNRCSRAPGVNYSIVAGTRGPFDPLMRLVSSLLVQEVDRKSQQKLRDSKLLDEAFKRTTELIESDELTKGLGDGAVSLKSAKLAGVADFQTLRIKHTEWCQFERPAVQDLLRHVAERIARQAESAN